MGERFRELGIIRDGALLVHDDRIVAVGTGAGSKARGGARRAEKLDLGGRVVLPGFVDSHTHLIFPASRAAEYEQRISGATYEEIAKSGGGIRSSVKALRRTPAKALKRARDGRPSEFASYGTTTIEAKSGYGLDWKSELKILNILYELHQEQPIDIASTFLGAHVVPPEFRRPGRCVRGPPREEMDSQCRDGGACGILRRLLRSRRIYGSAGAQDSDGGPRVRSRSAIHAEQLAHTGAARLAIELQAASADHLEKLDRADIRALALSNVVCTMLPGCCFHLGLAHYAPARKLIEAGAIVGVATDFNPGTSPTVSMPMILSLACTQMRMTPAEAISAATINPAYSLRQHDRVGSLEVGKYADLAAFDVADYREIPYYFGVNLCSLTMKRGTVIHSKQSSRSHEATRRVCSEFFRRPRHRQSRRHRRRDARSPGRVPARPRKRRGP